MLGYAQGGVEQGLAKAGKTFGDAILACLHDPDFRAEVDRITAQRLAAAEHKLVDVLLRRLDGPADGIEKSVLSILQILTAEKRAPASADAARPARQRSRQAVPAGRAETAIRMAKQAQDFRQLLASIRTRLAEAEQQAAETGNPQGSSIPSSRTRS